MTKVISRFTVFLALLSIAVFSQAQLTQRNLFKPFTEEYIKEALVAPSKWHPFPTTAQDWHKLLPDSIIEQYIANGNSSLQEFAAVSATGFLQFSRSKNSPQSDKNMLPGVFSCSTL